MLHCNLLAKLRGVFHIAPFVVRSPNLHSLPAVFLFASIALVQTVHSEEAVSWGAQLRDSYAQALAVGDPHRQEALRRAQRAWITLSDKNEALVKALIIQNILAPET